MALPYLPAEKIERRFLRLQQQATARPLQDFCSYIHENWDQHPDLPATDVERVPGSCQDQQWPRRLAQWPEPARQRTFAATPLHLNPAITSGSQLGEHANPSGFRQKAQETPAVDLQSYAEKTLRPLEAVWGRPKELEGASGGLFSPRSSNVNINKDKQTHKKRLL